MLCAPRSLRPSPDTSNLHGMSDEPPTVDPAACGLVVDRRTLADGRYLLLYTDANASPGRAPHPAGAQGSDPGTVARTGAAPDDPPG